MAGFLVRARRWDLLAAMLRSGVLRRLAARTGLRLDSERSVPESGTFTPPTLERSDVHSALSPLLPGASEREHRLWQRLFLEDQVDSKQSFEELSEELARLEAQAVRHASTPSPVSDGA